MKINSVDEKMKETNDKRLTQMFSIIKKKQTFSALGSGTIRKNFDYSSFIFIAIVCSQNFTWNSKHKFFKAFRGILLGL